MTSHQRVQGRVAVLPDTGGTIELREYDVPEPEAGGLILKVQQAPVCGSDLHIWRGTRQRTPPARPRSASATRDSAPYSPSARVRLPTTPGVPSRSATG
jgi:hypothetical protein